MNPASKAAIQIIRGYILALDEISVLMGYSFDELSYTRWFANELLRCLETHPSTPPLLIIESFRDKMDKYARLNKKFGFIFLYAHGMVEGVIDKLLS